MKQYNEKWFVSQRKKRGTKTRTGRLNNTIVLLRLQCHLVKIQVRKPQEHTRTKKNKKNSTSPDLFLPRIRSGDRTLLLLSVYLIVTMPVRVRVSRPRIDCTSDCYSLMSKFSDIKLLHKICRWQMIMQLPYIVKNYRFINNLDKVQLLIIN